MQEGLLGSRWVKPGKIVGCPTTRLKNIVSQSRHENSKSIKLLKLNQSGRPRGVSHADDPCDHTWFKPAVFLNTVQKTRQKFFFIEHCLIYLHIQ